MILFFGRLRDAVGADRLDCPIKEGEFSLPDLIRALDLWQEGVGEVLTDPSIRVAVNQAMLAIDASPTLKPTDEIAFMPPLSGG